MSNLDIRKLPDGTSPAVKNAMERFWKRKDEVDAREALIARRKVELVDGPNFIPRDGFCRYCRADFVSEYGESFATTVITGCSNCGNSFAIDGGVSWITQITSTSATHAATWTPTNLVRTAMCIGTPRTERSDAAIAASR